MVGHNPGWSLGVPYSQYIGVNDVNTIPATAIEKGAKATAAAATIRSVVVGITVTFRPVAAPVPHPHSLVLCGEGLTSFGKKIECWFPKPVPTIRPEAVRTERLAFWFVRIRALASGQLIRRYRLGQSVLFGGHVAALAIDGDRSAGVLDRGENIE
jgi:hypothetical protein